MTAYRLRDYEHLLRMGLLFAAGFGLFLLVQALVVPEGFGVHGHYRAGALLDNRARPAVHAGRAACGECHDEPAAALAAGPHAALSCEGCHGPQARHAEDGGKPPRPDARVLCARCHEQNVARPSSFPQVATAEHSGGESCVECHRPHAPAMDEVKP